jgi:hypothetical protein
MSMLVFGVIMILAFLGVFSSLMAAIFGASMMH